MNQDLLLSSAKALNDDEAGAMATAGAFLTTTCPL